MEFDVNKILGQLDEEDNNNSFPMLDNGYYYHGDQKLTIFRDDKRWAILIEVLAFHNHQYDVDGITNTAHTFGNCIITERLFDNDNFFWFAKDNERETFIHDEEDYIPFLNPKAESILVKNKIVMINHNREHYLSKGVELEYEDKIKAEEFMRGLFPEQSEFFWVTREEISKKIPIDLPIFMTLEYWHHPDLAHRQKPSDTETFKQLAQAIVLGDKSVYNTKEEPNTHWKNWPEGGNL